MKYVVLVATLVALAGCAQMRAERAYNDANATCSGSQDYAACMQYHAAQYQADQQRRAAASAQSLYYSQQLLAPRQTYQQQPTMKNTQCRWVGSTWNCNSF